MLNNRLIVHLQAFSRKEMTRFYEFVHSPYFNKHKDTQCLVAYLNKIFPHFNQKNCRRERIFGLLYPKQKFEQAQLALVFTYTFRQLEQFLIQEQFSQKKGLSNVFLLQHLRKKGQYQHYERVLKSLESNLEKATFQDSDFYHLQFIAATESDAYYAQLSKHQKDLRIQSKQDNLDYFYLSQKLRDACEMLLRSKILKVDYSTSLLAAVVAEVEQNEKKYTSIPAITIYYRIYQMFSLGETRFYHELLPMVKKHETLFSKEELHGIYNYLQSFAIEQFNQGKTDFLASYFHLYQMQLEKDLLLEKGYLSEWHYKNIVTVGTRLQENNWVHQFIEKYKEKLEPLKRENAYRFNLASYAYAIRDYDQVLDLLLTVEYKDSRYTQGVKALLLRTYFDLEEEEALYSLIDSFRQYVKRDKDISEARKKGFYNLLKFSKRTFALKMQKSFLSKEKFQSHHQKLLNDIETTAPIFNQTWLLEKMEDIMT